MAPPPSDGANLGTWRVCAGATLLMPSGPGGDHLYVVLNDPQPFDGYGTQPHVLLVNLSSVRDGVPFDETCTLDMGAHPFIRHRSYVVYRSARIEAEAHLLLGVQRGIFKPHDLLLVDVLSQVKAGLFASPHTKREFKRLKI